MREEGGREGGESSQSVDWAVLRCLAPVMAGNSEKVPIASAGPEDLQQFMPPVSLVFSYRPAELSGQQV